VASRCCVIMCWWVIRKVCYSVCSAGYEGLRVWVLDNSILGWSGAVVFKAVRCIRGVGWVSGY